MAGRQQYKSELATAHRDSIADSRKKSCTFSNSHNRLSCPQSSSQDRRGSAESAYYSICSSCTDRRASWQSDGCTPVATKALQKGETAKSSRSVNSVLCDSCEIRRFQPAERSPFHTRAHAEVVMAELAAFCGDRSGCSSGGGLAAVQVALSSPSVSADKVLEPDAACADGCSRDDAKATRHQQAHSTPPPADLQTLPPLMEEATYNNLTDVEDGSAGASISLVGRLNSVGSCDLRRHFANRQQGGEQKVQEVVASSETDDVGPLLSVAPVTATTTTAAKKAPAFGGGGGGGRKFSLDARAPLFNSGARPSGAQRGYFRLFHQETSTEEFVSFNQQRRGSGKISAAAAAAASASSADSGDGHPEASVGGNSPAAAQNPSRLFRRFQSADNDYFVTLKVEEPLAEVISAPQERQRLLSITEDGRTLVVEVEPPPAPSSILSPKLTSLSAAAASSGGAADESEIEAAMRLAKTSPFAYMPQRRLEPSQEGSSGPSVTSRRDADWRRCVAEISTTTAPTSNRCQSDVGSSSCAGVTGSRVKRLMAKFGGE